MHRRLPFAIYPNSLASTLTERSCPDSPRIFAHRSGLSDYLVGLIQSEQSIQTRIALKRIGLRIALPTSKAVN